MWQGLRTELRPRGFEVLTVALDTGGVEAARPFIEAASAEHPSLIDESHLLDRLYGIVNTPSGVWIDEEGTIIRPPETAFARPFSDIFQQVEEVARPHVDAMPSLREVLLEAKRLPVGPGENVDPDRYLAAIRDWVARGKESRFALSPDEVVRRSHPQPYEVSLAAANFELAQHLYRHGLQESALPYFEKAYRLQPNNWTYKCQAWACANHGDGPTEGYSRSWVESVRRIGIENYYEPLDL